MLKGGGRGRGVGLGWTLMVNNMTRDRTLRALTSLQSESTDGQLLVEIVKEYYTVTDQYAKDVKRCETEAPILCDF